MSEHARYSPSGAKKWMTCIGSPAMEHGQPDDSNVYTDEGTAAHALASMCLEGNKHPAAFLGRVLHIVNGVYDPTNKTGAAPKIGDVVRSFEVDADMVAHVNTYVCRVKEYAERGELLVEERVPIQQITGEKDAGGTADGIVILQDSATLELQVHDLKFGMGVKVYAEKNHQGMMYLLGALHKFEPVYGRPSKFRFVIHQPRLDHLDEWDCTYDELMEFAALAKKRAEDATSAFEFRANWIGKDNSYLTPGEHCKNAFCKARATCPALAKYVTDAVGADFEVLTTTKVSPEQAVSIQFSALDYEGMKKLGEKNAAVEIILDWCKAIRARVEGALFENHNSEKAQQALGFKLVEGKRGNRQWEDVEKVEAALKGMRLKSEEIYDMSVKSPTQIEKVLKDHPKQWAKVTKMVTQKDGKPSVTELNDKRPALVIKPTADDFVVTDGSDLV